MSSYRRSSEPARARLPSGHARQQRVGVDRPGIGGSREVRYVHVVADVVLVSELHAAGALAQAVGRKVLRAHRADVPRGRYRRVVRRRHRYRRRVVGVQTRRLQPADVMADLREMIVSLLNA